MSDKRTGWLAKLKVGNDVSYATDYGRRIHIAKVVEITPSGRIRVTGPGRTVIEFSSRGRRGNEWSESDLCEVTDEIRAHKSREDVLSQLEGWAHRRDWLKAPTDKLDALWAFIKDWSGGNAT